MDEFWYSGNRRSFAEVCHGRFGREVFRTFLKEIDVTNVVDVLSQFRFRHWINARNINYLDHYFRGDQPALYKTKEIRPEINNKIVENHAYEIVEFFTSRHFGEPIQYVNRKTETNKTNETDILNKLMFKINKPMYDIQLGEWQVIAGTGYRKTMFVPGDIPIKILSLDPRYTYCIYDYDDNLLCSVQEKKDENNEKFEEVYTDDFYFKIQGDKIVDIQENGLRHNPIIEFPLNSRRLSYLEIVCSILDAINRVQSNRIDGVEQFVQAFIKFINCDVDSDEFLEMCKLGAIKVSTNNTAVRADVDMVSNELDQQQVQTLKSDLIAMFQSVLGMPSREQNTGGDTGNAVYLRNGWDFTEGMAKLWEPLVRAGENKTLEIIAYILKWYDGKYSMDIDTMDIDANITRNKTDNMLVKSQSYVNLVQNGVHPHDALDVVELFSDVERTYSNYRVREEELKEIEMEKQKLAIKQATDRNIKKQQQTPQKE